MWGWAIVGIGIMVAVVACNSYEAPPRKPSANELAMERLFSTCKRIVNDGLDADGQLTVQENNYFYTKCLDAGPERFVARLESGIYNLVEAQRHERPSLF